jgi:quercetin dioxygenase-like cupin family protein
MDQGQVSERVANRKKGQRFLTWDEPGEWKHDPRLKLSYASVPMAEDETGAAGMVLIVKYEPGSRVEPHFHHSDYCSVVVQGSIEVTRRNHEVGSIRIVNAGTVYGPLVAGPEGATVVEFFATGVPDAGLSPLNTYV